MLLVFCFFLPLQCYVIGDNLGIGIQGAVYRYQITVEGNSLIPITHELYYITSGLYSGKTALSAILWISGTILLFFTTFITLRFWNRIPSRILPWISMGISIAGVIYLGSCLAQYGVFFSGPAGLSIPIGILYLFIFIAAIWTYQNKIFST